MSVEGIHDVEILQIGFGELFRRYRIKDRGGRRQIEKDIDELQKAESKGDEIGNHFFVFDYDRKPSTLSESNHVKFLQLSRYCLENYLLDVDIITDLSREPEFATTPFSNTTQARDTLKQQAMRQLREFVARKVFRELGLEGVGFDMGALRKQEAAEVAADLWSQIIRLKQSFDAYADVAFESRFQELFQEEFARQEPVWDEKWRELCDGKRILSSLRQDGFIRGDLLRFKTRIVSQMKIQNTETWSSLNNQLRYLIRAA